MAAPVNAADIPYGSFALLWPVFIRLCFSHFVETVMCALQGRAVAKETGMSLFEHSLAFAEAENMVSHQLGVGMLGLIKQGADNAPDMHGETPLQQLSRTEILDRMNVTPELLLISLISCCNSLASNILDLFGKQSRFRFWNTALWGLCFMAALVWGVTEDGTPLDSEGLLKFPTACIIVFAPHFLVLLGIILCAAIYGLALAITAFSLPPGTPQPTSLRERFALAHGNMQGADQIQSIRFNRHEDFYMTLVRVGYSSLAAASEAVFLNEGKRVVARKMTWLEEDRLSELQASPPNRVHHDFRIPGESGYAHEKTIDPAQAEAQSNRSQSVLSGVGAFRSASRCYHGFAFLRGIGLLLARWAAHGLVILLARTGLGAPQRLKEFAGLREKVPGNGRAPLDFWILSDKGELELPENNDFDVEEEMRKRERSNRSRWGVSDEQRLDDKLYGWWKAGGCWGDQDQTADYRPSADEFDDTTSVVSVTDSEWEDESDGRRTPTQSEPFPTQEPNRESLLDMETFSRLLNPRDWESRQEARILAAHLSPEHDGQMLTRRRFQKQLEAEKARILLSSRLEASDTKRATSQEEEAELLEKLILARRSETSPANKPDQTWESGASGLGPNGPPCVICQTSPRSIITWPCRCLCVCEDCRVSLAMNNFGTCVTCRQEVGGFVRLWVP